MYVISSHNHERINAQIATVVAQVTASPVQIITCISKDTLTHEYIQYSQVLGIAILDQETPLKLIGNFGFKTGRDCDKFINEKYTVGITKCPLLAEHVLVTMEAKVKQQLDVGTHTLFIAELLCSQTIKDGIAMTYEYYHKVIKGKSPKNAPNFQPQN